MALSPRLSSLALGAAAFLLLAVWPGARAAEPSGNSLGSNLAGEACGADGAPSQTRPLDIACGTDATSGRLVIGVLQTLPSDAIARKDAILARAAAINDSSGELVCATAEWLDADTALLTCTLQSNSWPRIVLVSTRDGTLYRADGLPAMYPVLEAAIARFSGRASATHEAGQRVLEQKFPGDVLKSSAADFSNYKNFVELGRLAGGANNYAGAETAYRAALDIETRLFGPNSIAVGQTLCELALQVSNQSRFDEAAALFQRATPIIEGSSDQSARARLAAYRGLDAANQRHFEDALTYARAATAAHRAQINDAEAVAANGGPPVPATTRGELAHSLRIEAEMALRLNDLASAEAAADEALWIISEEPGLPLWWRPEAVALMAEVNARRGRVVTAERDFRDAVDLERKLFGDTAPTALFELKLGQFYSDQQVYAASIAAYREAFAILAKDPVARAQLVPDQIVPFVTAALAQPNGTMDGEVFRISQLPNSDVADQTIAKVAARQAAGNRALSGLIAQAQEAERARDDARMALAAEYAKADDDRNAAREQKAAADLKVLSANADALALKVREGFPEYARLADPGPAELTAVKESLVPGQAFVSFLFGAKESYALVVTSAGLRVRHLDISSDAMAADVAALRGAFVPKLGRMPDFSEKSSYALYQQLLKPAEADLAATDQLIVASSGDLASLPFALLVTSAPREGAEHAYSQAAWLVRRMAVSQVPSARAFLLLREARDHRIAAPRPFFGLGDPAFEGAKSGTGFASLGAACQTGVPVAPELLRSLPALPDTRHEVQTIAASLHAGTGSLLLGPNATESELRAQPLDQYAVVYFATHGLLPGELRCQGEPALVLSPPAHPVSTTDADGLLYASEISSLKLNADLVVLSACNTAATGGTRFGGGALEGLADSFFNAGARAVLASHWEVPSTATMKLMTAMFAHPGPSLGYAQSLRQAQLALIASPGTAHPFNWAAFTLIGDGTGAAPAVKTARSGTP